MTRICLYRSALLWTTLSLVWATVDSTVALLVNLLSDVSFPLNAFYTLTYHEVLAGSQWHKVLHIVAFWQILGSGVHLSQHTCSHPVVTTRVHPEVRGSSLMFLLLYHVPLATHWYCRVCLDQNIIAAVQFVFLKLSIYIGELLTGCGFHQQSCWRWDTRRVISITK